MGDTVSGPILRRSLGRTLPCADPPRNRSRRAVLCTVMLRRVVGPRWVWCAPVDSGVAWLVHIEDDAVMQQTIVMQIHCK